MSQVPLNYETQGSIRARRSARISMALLIVFFTAVALVAPFFAIPLMFDRRLPDYCLFGYAASAVLSFCGAIVGAIAVVLYRTSRRAWIGLLLNLFMLVGLIALAVFLIGSIRFAPGG